MSIVFKKDQIITAYGTRGVSLTKNKEYKCINGTEEGIFATRPFVTVTNDNGKQASYHQSRFELITYSDGTTNAGN